MNEHNKSSDFTHNEFLIVGLARDCEKEIQKNILTLFQAVKYCRAVSWLIVESDSTDTTVDVLQELKAQINNFKVISLGCLHETFPLRTHRIAHCRNVYLSELQSNPIYLNVNYVIIADLGGAGGLLTAPGLSSCWSHTAWDVCTANQRGRYFDIWALRHEVWSPNDCWRQYEFLVAHGARREAARYAAVYSKMVTIAESSEWIEVDSAFGGLAVYRRPVLTGVKYVGLTDSGHEICEHVTLHRQIKANGGKIFINPGLINAHDNEHNRKLYFLPTLRRYLSDFKNHATKRWSINL